MKVFKAVKWALAAFVLSTTVHANTVPLDVLFVIDGSSSVGFSAFEDEKAFANELIATQIDPSNTPNRVSALVFNDAVNVLFDFTDAAATNTALATNAIDAASGPSPGSAIATALNTGLDLFNTGSTAATRIALLFTDGNANPAGQSACGDPALASALRGAGIQIFVALAGNLANADQVDCLVNDRDTDVFSVASNPADLDIFDVAPIPVPPAAILMVTVFAFFFGIRLHRSHRQ